jgi:serine/threonine protein kinase/signal transduction histidine kinase
MNITGKIINNRYRIIECLGEGGTSFVYKVKDITGNTYAALKVMKESISASHVEDIIRFKREIDIVSKLSHPNIIKIFDAGEYENMPYLVTEYLKGETLNDYIRGGSSFDMDEILQIMKQLTEALVYVNSKSVIHRDLKPGNVFLETDKGKVNIKLLDFGVSHIMEPGWTKNEDEVVGTFGYMSPEVTGILNRKIDERSDLYSLGVMFYTLLAGEPPFKGKDVNRVLHQQVAFQPPDLYKVRDNIPFSLNDVVMKLIQKDPDLRYQTAKGLLFDLKEIIKGNYTFIPGANDVRLKLTYNTRVIGREKEVEIITNHFNMARQGRGSVLLLKGEAGVGKSALMDEISELLYENNAILLKGRCIEQKNKTPYQLFRGLTDQYISYLEKMEPENFKREVSRLKKLSGDFGKIYIDLNPSMEKYIGSPKQITALEPERENRRLLMMLSEFFLNLPGDRGVMVYFLDDLHWADDGSLSLLGEILRRMGNENILIIGTYRDNEIDSDHGISAIKAEATNNSYPLSEIKLSPLDKEKLNRLVAGLLGEKDEKTGELTGFIFNKSRGNPLFSINLLRELVEKGAVTRNKGYWELDFSILESIPVSETMLEVILGRVNNLKEEQVDILCKAAVIGREVEIDILHKLSGIDMNEFIELIDFYIDVQLIERGKDKRKIIFVHDRIREVFYRKLAYDRRKSIHLEVAGVIEEHAKDNLDNDDVLFRLVHHYVEAWEEEKMLEYVIPAAKRAMASYANEEAIKYYTIGIGLLEKRNDRTDQKWIDCCSELVDVYLTIGKNNEAIDTIMKILPFINGALGKSRAYRKMGIAYFKIGDWKGCEDNLSKGLALLGEKLPSKKLEWIRRLVSEMVVHFFHSIFYRTDKIKIKRKHREEDKEIISAYMTLNWMYILSDIDKLLCNIMRMLNISETRLPGTKEMGRSMSGYASALMAVPFFRRAEKYHYRAVEICEEIGEEWASAQCYQFFGYNYSWWGRHRDSINCLEKSKDKFARIGDMWELGIVHNGFGYAHRYTSQYRKGIEANEKYIDLSRRMNNTYGVISGYIEVSYCYIENGNFNAAQEHILKAMEICIEYKNEYLYCCTSICMGYLELERNNFGKAVEILEETREINERNSFIKDYMVNLYCYLTEAYIRKEEKEGNEQLNCISKERLKRLYVLCKTALKKTKAWPNHYAGALRCMGKYYVVAKKSEKARKYLTLSISYAKKLERKYEVAKGYFELGVLYESAGDMEKSRNAIKTAYTMFKEMEATEYSKKCASYFDIEDINETQNSATTMTRLNAERRLSTILAASRYLSSILDLDELLEKIMDCVLEHVGAQRGALFLYPEEGGKLEAFVVRNVSKKEIHEDKFKGGRSIIKRVEMEKLPITVSDALTDENFNIESSIIINKVRSVMCAPIISKGEMIGVIYLDNSLIGGLFSSEDLKVLDMIACQAGISVQNARLYKKMKLYSMEIEKSRDEIKLWNNTLEQRVAKRTEQLEVLNLKYKNLADELSEKNTELNEMIEKLKKYAETVEELTVTKERNRFAVDVHDTLGHTMVLLIKLLEVSRMEVESNPEKALEKLNDAISTAREGMKELKRSIYGLVPEKLEVSKFITALKKLIEDFKMPDVNIELKVEGIYDYRNPAYSYTLFKVCQETMTNSVRHGKAKNILIELKFMDKKMKLVITDDGTGCKTIKRGFGITGIEERIKELNGSVCFSTNSDCGFITEIMLPLEC